jgi:hypothetical protein
MGYYTSLNGEFTIDPPIRYADLAPEFLEWGDGVLRIRVEVVREDTPDGVLERRTGVAVEHYPDSVKAYEIESELQSMVDRYPDHTFSGLIEGDGENAGDMWRLIVRDRKVIKVTPTITWPEA